MQKNKGVAAAKKKRKININVSALDSFHAKPQDDPKEETKIDPKTQIETVASVNKPRKKLNITVGSLADPKPISKNKDSSSTPKQARKKLNISVGSVGSKKTEAVKDVC